MNMVVGPWIGAVEHELFIFRPYVTWLYTSLRSHCNNFYISTHAGHEFLYNWNDVSYLPVDEQYSNDLDHRGIINSNINNKNYLILVKQLKSGINESDVIHQYIRYTKYDNFVLPISKKIFTKVDLPVNKTEDILIIHRQNESEVIAEICRALPEVIEVSNKYNTKDFLLRIMSAKLVICPIGPWTFFCNLHKISVFSWGTEGIGMYKPDGVYHFNNNKSQVIYFTNVSRLLSGIEYVRNKIEQ